MKTNPLQSIRVAFRKVDRDRLVTWLKQRINENYINIFVDRRSKDVMIAYDRMPVIASIMSKLREVKAQVRGKHSLYLKIYKKRKCTI
jgi:hypothetical protein